MNEFWSHVQGVLDREIGKISQLKAIGDDDLRRLDQLVKIAKSVPEIPVIPSEPVKNNPIYYASTEELLERLGT